MRQLFDAFLDCRQNKPDCSKTRDARLEKCLKAGV